MKILMVTMSMNIGGAETHILELCRELKAMGNDVVLASFGGVYADEVMKSGVEHVTLPLHTKHPLSVLRSYRGLKDLIKNGKFDIVHAHARIPAFICGLLWDRLALEGGLKFRFVTTAHLNFSLGPLYRMIARWGERVMAVSDDIADYLVSGYGYPRAKIHTTINGVDCEKFSPDVSPAPVLELHGLDPAHRRIVTMSRLDEDRADPAVKLARLAPKLAEAFPDTDLLIVGGGTKLEEIRALAEDANRAIGRPYVTVTGAVSNTNEYCSAADVFVGVSRSALEAMAAAKPVILAGGQGNLGVFDPTKIDLAVNTNFCCRGLPLADEESLFSDLSSLLSMTREEREKMGCFNRAFIEERYTARRMAEDYLGMYEKTLASPVPFHMKKTAPDAVISGYYGFGNLGDESLLDIISETLAEAKPGVKIAALTKKPKKDAKRTGLACVSRFGLFSASRAIRRSSLLLSGGGSLLQDATSRRSLRYYAGLISYAQHAKTKTAVFANGIGPIRNEKNRSVTASVVGHSDYVSVRDEDSKAELISLGVDSERVRVSADPAFLIKPSSPERLNALLAGLGIAPGSYFALSLRPLAKLPKNGRKTALGEKDRLLVTEAVDALAEAARTYGLTPLIIPMQNSQDTAACEEAVRLARERGVSPVLWHPECAPDLIGVLGKAAFVTGMRLHSLIFASSAGTPVIGLSYDPKVSSMMKQLRQPRSLELSELLEKPGALSAAIRSAAADILSSRDEIARELAAVAADMRTICTDDMAEVGKLIRSDR